MKLLLSINFIILFCVNIYSQNDCYNFNSVSYPEIIARYELTAFLQSGDKDLKCANCALSGRSLTVTANINNFMMGYKIFTTPLLAQREAIVIGVKNTLIPRVECSLLIGKTITNNYFIGETSVLLFILNKKRFDIFINCSVGITTDVYSSAGLGIKLNLFK